MGSDVISMLEPGKTDRSSAPAFGASRYVRFGAFILDQQRQELFKNGARLKLQGKAFQVLLALLEHPGEVVTRDELRLKLWPSDTHVNFDANVNTTVNKLRQALGDSPEQPAYIETIPRKGYSFVALIEPSPAPLKPDPAAVVPNPGTTGVRNLSSNSKSDGAFVSGLAALVSNRLPLWLTIVIAGLIATGMLLGAGVTMYWISHASHFTPLR